MEILRQRFRQVFLVDCEFHTTPGEQQQPLCVVAHEVFSGETIRWWEDEMRRANGPPHPVSDDVLFCAFYASAEFKCYLTLGWALPANVLDLFCEFRVLVNGRALPNGSGLLGALAHFGLDAMSGVDKDSMRALAIRGGPFTNEERGALLDYCTDDVDALRRLLPVMVDALPIDHALIRGDYMKALARMEHTGVPLDLTYVEKVRANWSNIKLALIERIDSMYGVFDGETFKRDRFERFLMQRQIAWPYTEAGRPKLDEETFREMARAHPIIAPLHELRVSLAQLRLAELEVGRDGRNRTMLSAFRTRTGRNAPSTTRFIFGAATWIRGFIQPPPGTALAYCDYGQQEFAISGALSGDTNMMHAYATGDPYLAFAKQAGAAPPDATKETHEAVREQFKACSLGVLYGMGAFSLGQRIGQPTPYASDLLRVHRETYPTYWKWSDGALDYAMMFGQLHTIFGWRIHVAADARAAALRNWPVQSTGAEILRLACCLATETGITVAAPVHDALLVAAPLEVIDDHVARTKRAMQEAGRIVLGGFDLRTDAKVIRHPDRFMDKRGGKMWSEIAALLADRGGP